MIQFDQNELQTCQIDKLPNEILIQIFSYLSIRDLCVVEKVNQFFSSLIQIVSHKSLL